MKTKYIKVPFSQRLPGKDGDYYTEQGLLMFEKGTFWQFEGRVFLKSNKNIEYWLEEVPDREEEMRGLLKEVYDYAKEWPPSGLASAIEDKIKQIGINE